MSSISIHGGTQRWKTRPPTVPTGSARQAGDDLPAGGRHSIEERIVDLHRAKRELADSLLEGTDVAARMSPGDTLAMLQQGLGK